MGFETRIFGNRFNHTTASVNLPRWGLKRPGFSVVVFFLFGVNLPRWGLKRVMTRNFKYRSLSVNLPRWGLKLVDWKYQVGLIVCKFTPLGFET